MRQGRDEVLHAVPHASCFDVLRVNFVCTPRYANTCPVECQGRNGCESCRQAVGRDFPVPELAALIDEALVANSDLRIAAERVELARAQFGIERAAIFPSLVLGVSGSRGRLPGSGPIRNEISEYGDASVVIPAWEIDLWGKLRDRAETRRREMLSSEALVNAARISLVAQVSTLYLELLDFDDRWSNAAHNQDATICTSFESPAIR